MHHRRSSIAACLVLGVALSACGGSEKEPAAKKQAPAKPAALKFELTGEGKAAKITGPATADTGLVELEVANKTDGDHSAQIFALQGNHTIEEGFTAGEGWGEKGTPLPEWMRFHGGVGSLKPGSKDTVTLSLPTGKYFLVDIESDREVYAEFEVKKAGGKLPAAKATITASEYKFKGTKLAAGKAKVLFKNAGREPHHLLAAPLKDGKTIEDVRKFFTDEEGDAPIDEARAFNTAILDGGGQELVDVDFQAGRYVMFCFVPDRKGGPPHAFKGMTSLVTVTQ